MTSKVSIANYRSRIDFNITGNHSSLIKLKLTDTHTTSGTVSLAIPKLKNMEEGLVSPH